MHRKYSELTKEILLYLVAVGAIALAVTSPFILMQLAKNIIRAHRLSVKGINANKVSRALQRLRQNRVIILKENENGNCIIEFTEKGKRKIKEIQLENLTIEKSPQWDGRWRIVIFDIPEQGYRTGRDVLRDKLQKLGFVFIQKSVWVLPWPCEKEILFLGELYNITPFINIITAENIYNDLRLRKHFNL